MSTQLWAYHETLFNCKNSSGKAGSYHQPTLATSCLFETLISLDELASPTLKPTPSVTECHFVFRIESLFAFRKHCSVRTVSSSSQFSRSKHSCVFYKLCPKSDSHISKTIRSGNACECDESLHWRNRTRRTSHPCLFGEKER